MAYIIRDGPVHVDLIDVDLEDEAGGGSSPTPAWALIQEQHLGEQYLVASTGFRGRWLRRRIRRLVAGAMHRARNDRRKRIAAATVGKVGDYQPMGASRRAARELECERAICHALLDAIVKPFTEDTDA